RAWAGGARPLPPPPARSSFRRPRRAVLSPARAPSDPLCLTSLGADATVNALSHKEFSKLLMAKLHLITYGCQMNEYDSERVAGLLRERDYELTADEGDADVILLNTCAIREKAEDKVFSKLGELKRLKAQRPGLVIGVMGCMAQLQQRAVLRRAPIVDLVFGSPAIARVGELVGRARRERTPVVDTAEAPLVKPTAKPPGADRPKAFVPVQGGREKHCTFCV